MVFNAQDTWITQLDLRKFIRYPGAPEKDVAIVESNCKCVLPTEYAKFMRITDGLRWGKANDETSYFLLFPLTTPWSGVWSRIDTVVSLNSITSNDKAGDQLFVIGEGPTAELFGFLKSDISSTQSTVPIYEYQHEERVYAKLASSFQIFIEQYQTFTP